MRIYVSGSPFATAKDACGGTTPLSGKTQRIVHRNSIMYGSGENVINFRRKIIEKRKFKDRRIYTTLCRYACTSSAVHHTRITMSVTFFRYVTGG